MGEAFEEFLASVRYGTFAVNTRTGFGFLTAAASWRLPGHTIDDVQSGIGVVHNALLSDEPRGQWCAGPFRTDSAIADHRTAVDLAQATVVRLQPHGRHDRPLVGELVGKPSLTKLTAIFASALRG